jgi:uroporphyrinogen decarboxylase
MENSARDLADESVRLARTYDWDFLKPQCRFQCFAEAWGAQYERSLDGVTPPSARRPMMSSAADLGAIRPVDPSAGALGEQLEALRLIRAESGPEIPIIWTIFSPLMIFRFMVGNDTELFLKAVHEWQSDLPAALEAISTTMAEFAALTLDNGADGIFFAENVAMAGVVSGDEYARLGTPSDLPILHAVNGAPFNVMHVCGAAAAFEPFFDYPVTAFNWEISAHNPSLSEMRQRTGKAVIGGVSHKPRDLTMTPHEVHEEVVDALRDTGGRGLIIGPGCSNSPGTPDAYFRAASAAAAEWRVA